MNEAADRSRKAGMEENMKAVFISNYINHHQIPFSNALYEQLGDDYHFIQTEPMEEERIAMGWGLDAATLPYVVWADREEERCRKLIEEADLVFAGWTKRLDLVLPRLSSGKLTFRVSERIYREGQWKAISPKGLLAKYKEHIRFRNQPVWLLCCGAYVASDFSLIGAYPGKKLKFGYFPETLRCPQEELFAKKNTDKLQIVWAGRMISLKHPEFAVKLAGKLQEQGYSFELHFAGGGPMEEARLFIVIAIADTKAVFSRLCLYLIQVFFRHLHNLLHRFLTASGNAGIENFSLLQCDDRFDFQRTGRNSCKLSNASAML